MATALTSLFGTENLTVTPRTPAVRHQIVNVPGIVGAMGQNLGVGPRQIDVTGTLYVEGETYNTARAALLEDADDIADDANRTPRDFSYRNVTYYDCLVTAFALTSRVRFNGSKAFATFAATIIELSPDI